MIDQLWGTVIAHEEQALIIRTGSWAMRCLHARPVQYALGTEIHVYTYLHWSADQAPLLVAFEYQYERMLFTTLIGCSGVGPKLALAALAHMGAPGLLDALMQRSYKTLATVPGIGIKKAEALCVALSDKLDVLKAVMKQEVPHHSVHSTRALWDDTLEALKALGYPVAQAQAVIRALQAESSTQTHTFEELLRMSLKRIATHTSL